MGSVRMVDQTMRLQARGPDGVTMAARAVSLGIQTSQPWEDLANLGVIREALALEGGHLVEDGLRDQAWRR